MTIVNKDEISIDCIVDDNIYDKWLGVVAWCDNVIGV